MKIEKDKGEIKKTRKRGRRIGGHAIPKGVDAPQAWHDQRIWANCFLRFVWELRGNTWRSLVEDMPEIAEDYGIPIPDGKRSTIAITLALRIAEKTKLTIPPEYVAAWKKRRNRA